MAQKLKKGPQSRAPLQWGEGAKNLTARRHLACHKKVPKSEDRTIKIEEGVEEVGRKSTVGKDGVVGIGTWNVRTLNGVGRLEEVKAEMKTCKMNILGLSEVRWKGQEDFVSDGIRIITSGGEQHQKGVAIMLSEEMAGEVLQVKQCSDRLMMVKIRALPVDIVIIQVYMPTTQHDDEEIDQMYEQIENLIDQQKGNTNVIVMGDFNAVVGEGSDDKVIGKYGLGKRNERGQRMSEFCKKNQLVVTNTWFKQEERRRYTWKKPGDTGRYQIDYILARQRYRNGVKCCKSYPGADVGSDHNLVAMKMSVNFKTVRKAKMKRKWNREKMKRNSTMLQRCIEERVKVNTGMDVNQRWNEFRDTVLCSAKEQIGYEEKVRIKKPWITEEMTCKMKERKSWKNKNSDVGRIEYRRLNNELRREAEKAREAWWAKECEELEELNLRGRTDLVYERVAKLTWKKETKRTEVSVVDNAGNEVNEPEEVREIWRQYIEALYDKDGKPRMEELKVEEEEKEVEVEERGPEVLKSEIMAAIREMKEGKAVGVDEIPAEMLKNLGERAQQEIYEICKEMYEKGEWPDDFTRTNIIPLPKKNNAVKCSDYRTISLICHASKIMLKVLTKRLEAKASHLIGRNQFGFRKGCGTRDAIGVMRTLCERSMEHDNKVYICFVDFEKAFDRVSWIKMFEILKDLRVDWKDRRLLRDLYVRQEAVVQVAGGESRPGVIGRGVRQGCPISPLLFSIYAEVMMVEALEDIEEGVIVGGKRVSDVRFADDQGMVSNTEAGLQRIMNKLNETAKRYDMKINVPKTKTMVVCWEGGGVVNVTVDGQRVEQVDSFKYLGSIISEDGTNLRDVKTRIALAKEAFNKRKELLTKRFSRALKKRITKVLIWPVVLYGCETWTLRKAEIDRLQALEMWIWRRLEKISWEDKISNVEVLDRVGETRCLIRTICQRKKNWIGHVLRGEGLLRDVLEGRMLGKKRTGRPRMGMIDDIMEKSFVKMKRRAEGRNEWRDWVPRTCLRAEYL